MQADSYVKPCDPTMAMYDPACRARKRAPYEVAYQGYGVFRGVYTAAASVSQAGALSSSRCVHQRQTSDISGWNAWLCSPQVIVPSRLVIEVLDEDAYDRQVVPLALQTGGYVNLLNGGKSWKWDGYLRRRSTFITTVATGRREQEPPCV